MIGRILRSYTFVGAINRLDLFVGLILVSFVVWLGVNLLGFLDLVDPAAFETSQLWAVALGIVTAILASPLLIARLKDIRWSPGWVAVYVFAVAFSFRNLLILEEKFGEPPFSYAMKIISILALSVTLFLLGTLLLRRSQIGSAS